MRRHAKSADRVSIGQDRYGFKSAALEVLKEVGATDISFGMGSKHPFVRFTVAGHSRKAPLCGTPSDHRSLLNCRTQLRRMASSLLTESHPNIQEIEMGYTPGSPEHKHKLIQNRLYRARKALENDTTFTRSPPQPETLKYFPDLVRELDEAEAADERIQQLQMSKKVRPLLVPRRAKGKTALHHDVSQKDVKINVTSTKTDQPVESLIVRSDVPEPVQAEEADIDRTIPEARDEVPASEPSRALSTLPQEATAARSDHHDDITVAWARFQARIDNIEKLVAASAAMAVLMEALKDDDGSAACLAIANAAKLVFDDRSKALAAI